MNLKVLKEMRGAKAKEAGALIDTAQKEKRSLKADELTKINGWHTEVKDLDVQIAVLEDQQAIDARGAQQLTKDEQKTVDRFSIVRAFHRLLGNQALDGAELEMHQEGQRSHRGMNQETTGNLVIPAIVLQRGRVQGVEARDQTATGGSNGSEGGVLIQTSVGTMIERLRAKLIVGQMGATQLGGLVGNIDFPVFGADDQAAEKSEVAAANESSPTWTKKTISPKRLPVFGEYSRQLLAQVGNVSVESMVRDDLAYQIAKVIDLRAIAGDGSSNRPTGILSTSGIGSVVGGTDGAAPDHDDIIDLETEVAIDDADLGRLGYLTTPGVRGKLKKTKTDSGSGIFVWPTGARELNGYNVGVTTQVPSTLTKGASSGVCHAIIFGNFADLIVAQWGGLEFLVNPFAKDTEGIVRINAWTFYDILVRRAQSFAAMKDALVS